MKIDYQLLMEGSSERGGWNREQVQILGIEDWPLKPSWYQKILGRHISEQDAGRFLSLKGVVNPRKARSGKRKNRDRDENPQGQKKFNPSLQKVEIWIGTSAHKSRGAYAWSLSCGAVRDRKTLGYYKTTPHRQNLLGIIAALGTLTAKSNVLVYCDASYVVDGMARGWAEKWKRLGWKHGEGKRANWDLWDLMLSRCSEHIVNFRWVRGTDSSIYKLSELAAETSQSPTSQDLMYEKILSEQKGKW